MIRLNVRNEGGLLMGVCRVSSGGGLLQVRLSLVVCFAVVLGAAVALFWADPVMAQEGMRTSQVSQPVEDGEGGATETEDDTRFSTFVTLHRDLDVATYFERAAEFAAAGRYETAVRSLQQVFEADQAILIQRGPRVFHPSHLAAEDLLLQWPPEALETYRIAADPSAAALFRRADEQLDTELLSTVVQRYFLSSYGDEAAFRLACHRLDRGDFASAYRLLTQLRERYPDPTVPDAEVLLRLAVTGAKVGQPDKARQFWAEYRAQAAATDPSWLTEVEKLVPSKAEGVPTPERADAVSPVRIASLPEEDRAPGVPMATRWQVSGFPGGQVSERFRDFRELLEFAWRREGRRPVDGFLADGDRVWASSPFGVAAFTVGGRELWSNSGVKPSRHLSGRDINDLGLRLMGLQGENLGIWSAFGDHMEGRISLADGILYRVEGSWYTFSRRVKKGAGRRLRTVLRRSGSHLAAYDSDTGRSLWRVGGGEEGMKAPLKGARFLNAPVPLGRNVLVCFEKNDEMRLAALEPGSGEINWEVGLCSYEAAVAAPEAPVDIAVDGSTVFILTGKGAVFCVDGLTGTVHWLTTYDRVHDKAPSGSLFFLPRDLPPRPVTWEENWVVPHGRHLLVMPYDAPTLLSFSRTSGELIYKSEVKKPRYPLGISEDKLIVAGEGFIEARHVGTGAPVWREAVEPTSGRGLLTDRGILLPVDDEMRVMSAETGRIVARFAVAVGGRGPLGNLYAHDGRLYATGLGHLFRIDRVNALREELNHAVAAGDNAAAFFERGQLHMRLGEYRAAVDDLRKAHSMAEEDPRRAKYRALRDRLRDVEAETQQVLEKVAWFADDFDRDALGGEYEATQGSADIRDGTLHLTGNQTGVMELRLAERVPGNFRVRIAGWQPADVQRASDLSFRLDMASLAGSVEKLYVMFGTNWNARNKLLIHNEDVGVTTDYLIKPGVRHEMELVRIGARIKLSVDGHTVVDQQHRDIPASVASKTSLHLYGFGEDHYYDNLTIARLDDNGDVLTDPEATTDNAHGLERKLARLEEQRRKTSERMQELRAAGYARSDPVRDALFEALLKHAAAGGQDAAGLLTEARELTRNADERRRVLIAAMDAAENRGEFEKAARTGYRILGLSDDTMRAPNTDRPGWRVAPAVWLRMRLDTLLAETGDKAREALHTVTAERLEELRNTPGHSVVELYRMMLASPPVPAAVRAGLVAADEAVQQENPVQAELILLHMVDARDESVKAAGMAGLADFYERRGWPRIALRTWRRLADSVAADASVVTPNGTATVQALANAAVERLAEVVDPARGPEPATLPNPPYKRIWERELPGRPLRMYHKDIVRSDFTDEQFFLYDHRANTLSCHAIAEEAPRWRLDVPQRSFFLLRGHAAFQKVAQSMPRAISLLSGEDVWDAANGAGASVDVSLSQLRQSGGIFLVNGDTARGFGQIAGLDATTGRVLWKHRLLERSNQLTFNESIAANLVRKSVVVESERGTLEDKRIQVPKVFRIDTGEFVEQSWRFPAHNGMFVLTRQGAVTIEDGKMVVRRLGDKGIAWEHTLEPDERTSIFGIENSSLVRIQSISTFSLFDPEEQRILWTVSAAEAPEGPDRGENWVPGYLYREAALLPGTDALWLEAEIRRGRTKVTPVRIVDIQTGESQLAIENDGDVRLRFDNAIANDDYILLQYQRYKTKGRGRYTVENNTRLLSRETGEVVPNSILPPPEDRDDDKQRVGYYGPCLMGDKLLLTNGKRLLLYEHRDTAPVADP